MHEIPPYKPSHHHPKREMCRSLWSWSAPQWTTMPSQMDCCSWILSGTTCEISIAKHISSVTHIVPSWEVGLRLLVVNKCSYNIECVSLASYRRCPYTTARSSVIWIRASWFQPTYLVDLLVSANNGSCSFRFRTCPMVKLRVSRTSMMYWQYQLPISFQFCKSLLACIGMPGNALKLEEAQKKVLFQSGTNIQLGSGWKPGRMGLWYVEFETAWVNAMTAPAQATRDRLVGFMLHAKLSKQ